MYVLILKFQLGYEKLYGRAFLHTSLARGTRPSTEVTTDQTNVDMLRTTVSETPARIHKTWESLRSCITILHNMNHHWGAKHYELNKFKHMQKPPASQSNNLNGKPSYQLSPHDWRHE